MAQKEVPVKRERGHPVDKPYPPRIDATADELVQTVLKGKPPKSWKYMQKGGDIYHCGTCQREVSYPEILYRDGNCEACHE